MRIMKKIDNEEICKKCMINEYKAINKSKIHSAGPHFETLFSTLR